jgi:hypothetical protein
MTADSSPSADATPSDAPPSDATPGCTTDDAGTAHLASFLTGPVPGTTDSFTAVESLAADDSAVYASLLVSDFGSDGSSTNRIDIVRVPLDCGSIVTLLASKPGQDDVWSSLVSGNRLYLEMTDGIYSVPTVGGALTTEAVTHPLFPANGWTFAVSGGTVGWIDDGGALWTVGTGGGQTPQALASAPASDAGLGRWTSIAMDSTNVYATAVPDVGDAGADGADAAAVADAAAAAVDAGGDADDAGGGDRGSVVAIPLTAGAGTVLATGQHVPRQIMVSGTALYWTNSFSIPTTDTASSHGPILSLTLPSGAPTTLVSDDVAPEQLTLRGGVLTWIVNGGPDGEDAIHSLVAGTVTNVPTPRIIGLDTLTLGPKGAYWAPSGQELYGIAF